LTRRLRAAGASRPEVSVGSNPEAGTVRKIRLDDPELAFAALRHFWLDYELWHPQFIAWITDLATNHPVDTRNRAAVVVGLLALDDFTNVCTKVLRPWVQCNTASYRAAIGKVLAFVVQEERRRPEVGGLLKTWASASSRELRWAAARAYVY